MTGSIAPWRSRISDFSKSGWHALPTVAYELMFEFLRLSPSYELARKHQNEGLTDEELARLPDDFDLVLNTYQLLGDVQKTLFREWWLERGLKVFGNPFNKPKIHRIGVLEEGKRYATKSVASAVLKYMEGSREQEGLSKSALLAVPLSLKRSEIRKQLEQILDRIPEKSFEQGPAPQIKLVCKRLRTKTLLTGLRLLWFKAAKPKWELWRLGAHSRLSTTYSPVLKSGNPRRVNDTLESVDREMMTKITSRALKKFEAIAENAARGRFPTNGTVQQSTFNYPELSKRIQTKNRWENERIRYYKKHENTIGVSDNIK